MGGSRDLDLRIAAAAAAKHGVLSREELLELGVGRKAIEHRARTGRLHRVHRAVYAIGHPLLDREGMWRAAVLASGDRAVLSHQDAAVLWGMHLVRAARIDVTTPLRNGRRPPSGVRLHRVSTLGSDEVTLQDSVPVTTPMRTILDCAPVIRGRRLEALIAQADRLELFDGHELRRLLAVHPRQPGTPELRGLLDRLRGVGAADTRSEDDAGRESLP